MTMTALNPHGVRSVSWLALSAEIKIEFARLTPQMWRLLELAWQARHGSQFGGNDRGDYTADRATTTKIWWSSIDRERWKALHPETTVDRTRRQRRDRDGSANRRSERRSAAMRKRARCASCELLLEHAQNVRKFCGPACKRDYWHPDRVMMRVNGT